MQISLGKYRPQLLTFIEAMRTEYGLLLAVPPNKVKKKLVADILIYFIEKYDLHIYYNEPCFRTNPKKRAFGEIQQKIRGLYCLLIEQKRDWNIPDFISAGSQHGVRSVKEFISA